MKLWVQITVAKSIGKSIAQYIGLTSAKFLRKYRYRHRRYV